LEVLVRRNALRMRDAPATFFKEDDVADPVPEHEHVPFWAWSSVLVLSTIVTCVVMGVQFGQNVGVTLLGVSASC
jgi:hypothetical protein